MPDPLPEPPEDYESLASLFPALPKERVSSRLFRIHRIGSEPEWFGTSGSYRWDPPPVKPWKVSTIFMGSVGLGRTALGSGRVRWILLAELDAL